MHVLTLLPRCTDHFARQPVLMTTGDAGRSLSVARDRGLVGITITDGHIGMMDEELPPFSRPKIATVCIQGRSFITIVKTFGFGRVNLPK